MAAIVDYAGRIDRIKTKDPRTFLRAIKQQAGNVERTMVLPPKLGSRDVGTYIIFLKRPIHHGKTLTEPQATI